MKDLDVFTTIDVLYGGNPDRRNRGDLNSKFKKRRAFSTLDSAILNPRIFGRTKIELENHKRELSVCLRTWEDVVAQV